MVHGFPESWYSWRHQLPVLAAAGYRAVAIDVRGYGRSSKPYAVDAYRMLEHVADNVELVAALGEQSAVVVGHDWGAPIAWNSALLRPDVFRAVAGLSVPYNPRGAVRPTDGFRAMGGDEEFYIEYYQRPGRAEAEIEPDLREWLLGFYHSASGDADWTSSPGLGIARVAPGGEQRDKFLYPPEGALPAWLTEEDLGFYVAEFEYGGFRGPLNRYRNVDRDWEDLAAWRLCPVAVPALFVGGAKDGPTAWGARAIARFGQNLPRLWRSVILEGCGHWTQQERPGEVNELLVEFLGAVGRP
ncbi:MAG: alpha/beta fold hydrolase [Acidimicrobiia bacterium]|nr:alpha/beta fold hydrolase [Acidimicrobiia bacterium]